MASFLEVAVSDMRKPGQPTPYYPNSYALNDDTWWLRISESAQKTRAVLVQGRYPTSEAWNPSINQDYGEVSWLGSEYSTKTWNRLSWWNHVMLGDTYKNNHAAGFTGNTRVMIWGTELWVKSKSIGVWTRRLHGDLQTGDWWETNFTAARNRTDFGASAYRIEASTGYMSVRTPNVPEWTYALWHGWSASVDIDPWDVADVISVQRTALVLHDPLGIDDRDASRFLAGCGADYIPTDALGWYPGVGTSKAKFVRAKWPNWQFHVMHTMTEAQIRAPGGCPDELLALSEGGGDPGPGPGPGPGGTTIHAPTVGEWQPLLVGGKAGWGTSGVTGSPSGKIRRRRGIVLME
jgi:hypothetical protein